ncbi:MAG: hypothetical protein R3D03_12795 [Geminicoccaceae bacterium]|nr:hypothetical protein [Geminicoccaceae bacterium]
MAHRGDALQQALSMSIRGLQSFRETCQRSGGRSAGICDYCGSTIPWSQYHCSGCGAAAPPQVPAVAASDSPDRRWVVPLLLCMVFPPVLVIVAPILFVRWIRRPNRGWIVPVLFCLLFPPAVIVVAPALLWRSPARQ